MNRRYPVIDYNFKRVDRRWRQLRLLQHTATLGCVALGLLLLLGSALRLGWVATPGVAKALIALLIAGGVLTWFILFMVAWGGELERARMAGLLERGQPHLLDRLNALVWLEKKLHLVQNVLFYQRIAQQAQQVLSAQPAASSLPARRPLLHLLVLVLLLAATIYLNHRFAPWAHMLAAHQARLAAQAQNQRPPEPPLELPPPQQESVEQQQLWGEVRITDPARDLQVTKVDVVPLQIEAAASDALKSVAWLDAVNGSQEKVHDLPSPAEPRYAAYNPTLYLDELKLADWDVLTYYARAKTRAGQDFSSEVYFLEVRPFREDILKMPGGPDGLAYQCMNELTSLIEQQQHVIRETHRHVQKPPELPQLEEQDRKKIADAETDLAEATKHLYAKMATEMENKPIGEALDELAKAEEHLRGAAQNLRDKALPEAQPRERDALAALVAARKGLQKTISENPDALQPPESEDPDLAHAADQIKAMAEFRDEAKAAEQFVQDLAKRQQQIARQAKGASASQTKQLSSEEKAMQKQLEDFANQHPAPFEDLKAPTEQACQTLQKAAQELAKSGRAGQQKAEEASQQLQQLQRDLAQQSAQQQLTDAYKLKQILDQQIQTYGQCQQAPGSFSSSQLHEQTAQTRNTLKELKQLAEQSPTRDAFGPPLRDALSDMQMTSLQWPLRQLENAQDDQAKSQAAGQTRQALSQISRAFEDSLPQSSQAAKKADTLFPQGEEQFERGMNRLENLLQQLEQQRPISQQDQAKQGREALYNIQSGLPENPSNTEQGQDVLRQLRETLQKGETPLDVVRLRKILEQLRRVSVELAKGSSEEKPKPEVTNIDPARLPPAYRRQIEQYFQKLSEK